MRERASSAERALPPKDSREERLRRGGQTGCQPRRRRGRRVWDTRMDAGWGPAQDAAAGGTRASAAGRASAERGAREKSSRADSWRCCHVRAAPRRRVTRPSLGAYLAGAPALFGAARKRGIFRESPRVESPVFLGGRRIGGPPKARDRSAPASVRGGGAGLNELFRRPDAPARSGFRGAPVRAQETRMLPRFFRFRESGGSGKFANFNWRGFHCFERASSAEIGNDYLFVVRFIRE